MQKLFLLLILTGFAFTNILSNAKTSMQEFSNLDKVIIKTFIPNKNQVKSLKKRFKKFDLKPIYYYFTASNDKYFGILLNSSIRSKNVIALYILDQNNTLQDIEILAFHEPKEYKPSQSWLQSNITKEKSSNITGATLSARAIKKQVVLSHEILSLILSK